MKSMKYIFLSLSTLLIVASCGIKVPLTEDIKKQYNLDESNLKGVQFYVSDQIILEQSQEKGSSGTTSDGTLVNTKSNEKNRLIILPRTKCVFEEYVDEKTIKIRFESGKGRTLTFAMNPNRSRDKFYFKADWVQGKGGKIEYDNQVYYATPESINAYIMVKVKRSQKTKRKDRRVKGMKV